MALTALNATRTTIIDGDDFVAAADDSKIAALVCGAVDYGATVEAAGKDHSLDADKASPSASTS
jgi:hypothetical protein